ncbi:GNAT family N-acetyltransferase [Cellulomonas iranensis]|uniref:GNAT family N-acetyltransferase n=1 Tax=Cellulomonas iranensis TaxID=76862 RepID=UPI000B3D264E|nr:GNAT family N-acetyltransferase [Cellulomonas iranensis]
MGVSGALAVVPLPTDRLDELLELCREHAAYERAEFREDGQVDRWRAALGADVPALHAWAALDGDRMCGFMTATTDFATWSARRFAYLDCLYLRAEHRGRGFGRMFFDRLVAFAREQGCGWLEWQTPVDNATGIGFYEHLGARSRAKQRFTYEVEGREAR